MKVEAMVSLIDVAESITAYETATLFDCLDEDKQAYLLKHINTYHKDLLDNTKETAPEFITIPYDIGEHRYLTAHKVYRVFDYDGYYCEICDDQGDSLHVNVGEHDPHIAMTCGSNNGFEIVDK